MTMCECGCSNFGIDKGFVLPDGTELTYRIYQGCADCFPGVAVDISVFTHGNEWTEDEALVPFVPDEHGGHHTDSMDAGIQVPLLTVDDLREAAKDIVNEDSGEYYFEDGEYLLRFIDDHGLDMLQRAMRKFRERMR